MMNSSRKPNSSYFGPRRRISLRESEGRFRSKPMMKINKEFQKLQANMKCVNRSKSNHNVYNPRANVVTRGANTISPNDSNICPSSDLVAKNSNSGYVLASKRASQPTTLRLKNSLNPSSDFKCSKPSIVRNALPSKIPKASTSRKSKDDSNAIPRHREQSHHIKTSRAISCRTDLKAMPNLIHKAKNVATSNLNHGALGSRRRGQLNSYEGEDINVGKEGTKTSGLLKSISVVDRMDPNKDESNKVKGSQDEVMTKEEGMKGHTCEGRATCGNHHKHANSTKTNDAPNFKLPNRVQSVGGNEKTNDVRFRRRKWPLLEEKVSTHVQKDLTHVQKDLTCRAMKRRRYIEANEDEEGNVGDQHPVHIEDVTTELTPQVSTSKHCVEWQCYCCSKPIDIPRWSGLFKIDGKEYISLAGHLSSKSCEKVWKLSSLPNVVQMTKVPRMAAWPKIFEASKPTGDNIGLYFFPPEMRHDEELDQLVNEVMDKDLILRAVIGEAEMLIFPSVLLPERYQTFRRKHYLWATFKAKDDKGDVIVEQEDEKEKHVSNQLDEVQSEDPDQEMILMKSAMLLKNQQFPAKNIQGVEGCCVQGPTNMWLEHESPEEKGLRDSSHRVVGTTAASTAVANAATVPTEASSFTTDNASFHSNHGLIRPSMEAPPQSSSIFGIVVRQAPNLEPEVKQFIQEMERKGALVSVMRGGGNWWRAMAKQHHDPYAVVVESKPCQTMQ